jgi:hypothetical protein
LRIAQIARERRKMEKESKLGARALFSFKAASRAVGVSGATLRRAADLGDLDCVRLGHRRFVPRAEILRLLRETEK